MDAANKEPGALADSVSQRLSNRAERLLRAMHQVICHDLPNQLVVVQSLGHLLEAEETASLGPDGREYLGRLNGAAQRAAGMVQFLKQMARLDRFHEPLEDIPLGPLGEEIIAEIHLSYPGRSVDLSTQWHLASVHAGRRSLRQAVVGSLRCGIDWCPARRVALRLEAHGRDTEVELRLAVDPGAGDAPGPAGARPDRPTLENRLELRMAQELVATWGGSLDVAATGPSFLVRVLVPSCLKR